MEEGKVGRARGASLFVQLAVGSRLLLTYDE